MKITIKNGKLLNAETLSILPYSYDYEAHLGHEPSEEAIETVGPMGFTFAGAELCSCGTILIDEDV